MATERKLQVACLWGLKNFGVRELTEEIRTQSPGAQVTYLLDKDILVVRGFFDDATEAAAVACIKVYFQQHMHHNLLDEVSRMHQIVKIDIGTALGSRRTLKYSRAPLVIKEEDGRTDALLTSMITATSSQVSRKWTPSLVRVEYFSKDPYCILERVAAATDTEISVEHSESKNTFVLVSADGLFKAEDALQRLEKLEGLLVSIDNPCQNYASFVPNTRGLRFCLQELTQLNDFALRRLLLDPDSPMKNNITEFMVPVSCRIDPSTNLFHVSGHLRNPRGIVSPPLLENHETTEAWFGFKFADVGKASENREAQYSKFAGSHQASPPIADPAAVGPSPVHRSRLSQTRHEIATRDLSGRHLDPWVQSGRINRLHPENDTRVSRPTLGPEPETSPSVPFRPAGIKLRIPVLPGGGEPLTEQRTHVPSTNPAGASKPLQSGRATKFETPVKAGPSASSMVATHAIPSQNHPTQADVLRKEAEEMVCSDIHRLAKLQSSPEDLENTMDRVMPMMKEIRISRTLPEPERSIPPSRCLSAESWRESHTLLASSEHVSEPGTRAGADDERQGLVDFSDSEHAMADDEKTTSVSSNLEQLESLSECSSPSLAVHSGLFTAAGAQDESSVPQSGVSAISDTLSESAASRIFGSSKRPPASTQSLTLAGGDVPGDDEMTPRQAKILPLASRSPKSPDERPRDQVTPESTQSIPISATDSTIAPQASGHGKMALGGSATFPYSMPPYQAHYQANPIPQDPWFESRILYSGPPAHDPPTMGQHGHSPSAMSLHPGYPIAYPPMAYPTLFPNWGISPMFSPEWFLPANPVKSGPATTGPHQWPVGYSLSISQQQQLLLGTTSQHSQFSSRNPMALLCEEFGPPTSTAGSCLGTTVPAGDITQTSTATFPGQHDDVDPPIQERLANENNDEVEFHSIMRQRAPNPSGGTRERFNSKVNEKSSKKRWRPFDDVSFTTKGASIPTSATAFTPESQPQDSSAHPELTKKVYNLLAPVLATAQVFPGPLQLEVQIGIATIVNKLGAAEESFMSFEELNEAICPRGSLNGPSTVFFDRLTTLPADIDHFFNIHVDGTRLFESAPSIRTIDYEFHCSLKTGLPLVVSIDEKGNASISKSKVMLGSVNISFPDRIWDAAAALHGYIGLHGELDPEVERATQSLAKNLWVEPNRTHVRLFTRVATNVLSVKKVKLKRTTYHHCSNDRYVSAVQDENAVGGFYLRVTEVQDLVLTTHGSNGEILEAACKSLEEMVKAHRQWWEVALFSPAIHEALGDGLPAIIGDEHRGWSPIDILGHESGLVTSAPASSTTQSVGHYGLGSLLRLATVVVENIDPVGYFNVGPVGSGGNKRQPMRLLKWRSS